MKQVWRRSSFSIHQRRFHRGSSTLIRLKGKVWGFPVLTLWLLISSELVFQHYNTHDAELNDIFQQRNDRSYEASDLFTGFAQVVSCFLIICSLLVVSSLQEKPNLKTSFNAHQNLPAYRLLTAPTIQSNYFKLQVNDLQVIYAGDGPALLLHFHSNFLQPVQWV